MRLPVKPTYRQTLEPGLPIFFCSFPIPQIAPPRNKPELDSACFQVCKLNYAQTVDNFRRTTGKAGNLKDL